MDRLTQEYWDDLYTKYPKGVGIFFEWLRRYQSRVRWDGLFNRNFAVEGSRYRMVNYSDLPIAMQVGIFFQFVAETDAGNAIEILGIESGDSFQDIADRIEEYFFDEYDDESQEEQRLRLNEGIVVNDMKDIRTLLLGTGNKNNNDDDVIEVEVID